MGPGLVAGSGTALTCGLGGPGTPLTCGSGPTPGLGAGPATGLLGGLASDFRSGPPSTSTSGPRLGAESGGASLRLDGPPSPGRGSAFVPTSGKRSTGGVTWRSGSRAGSLWVGRPGSVAALGGLVLGLATRHTSGAGWSRGRRRLAIPHRGRRARRAASSGVAVVRSRRHLRTRAALAGHPGDGLGGLVALARCRRSRLRIRRSPEGWRSGAAGGGSVGGCATNGPATGVEGEGGVEPPSSPGSASSCVSDPGGSGGSG